MKSENLQATKLVDSQLQKTPVAIIGMGCIFPEAENLQQYWDNILGKVDCITDVPPSRWNIDDYYNQDPKVPDKTYCKRGGFLPDIDFNPMEFGLPPNIMEVTDVSQMLSLVVAKQAMADAGYDDERNFSRDRIGVVLGVGGGQKLITPLTGRLQYPIWEKALKSSGLSDEDTQKIVEKIKLAYIGWEENSFPGMLGNVIAGRIANRLDLGGMNCVVDAACASSLSALRMALSELTEYRSDMMIAGGVDTDNSIFMYMCFSKTPAFSKQENPRPFDASSDGMMLGEGIGMMLLKRLEDAKRDGDRIYAVIKGIGTSSDGKSKSIYAPYSVGQARALHRAYEDAGFAPSTVGLIEAHGTGTMAGDPTEFSALNEVLRQNNPKKQHIALGSVKSQIGHTKATAGAASLIKTALALHHKVLPATINITKPHPKLQIEDSPLYLNTETRPWIRSEDDAPRRAGVSSFGFGGTNYHVVLEEYESEHNQAYRLHSVPSSILLGAPTVEELLSECATRLSQLQAKDGKQHYAALVDSSSKLKIPLTSARVGFAAASVAEACQSLQIAMDLLKNRSTAPAWEHPQGIYYRRSGIESKGKVVALFSGQGSQYLEMGRELGLNFPTLRKAYGDMDKCLGKDGLGPISEVVFPRPVFEASQKDAQVKALQQTENAQAAIGVFSFGLYKILQQANFQPDFVAGHSFGELTALWAGGVLEDEDYLFLVKARAQAMASPADSKSDPGVMLAVKGELSQITATIKNFPRITIANWNSNNQVVLAGAKAEITEVQNKLEYLGYSVVLLPVSAAFHSPLVTRAQKSFEKVLGTIAFSSPKIPVYSNTTGNLYPNNSHGIRQTLAAHILKPVNFKQEIENISAAGGYFFVEFGPKNILTNLVNNILEDKPHLAVALNASSQRDSQRQLCQAVVQLRVAGLPLDNLDTYQTQAKVSKPKKGATVALSGNNYVSPKTKAAFEEALQDGHQIKGKVEHKALSQGQENGAGEKSKSAAETKKSSALNQQPSPSPIPNPQSLIPLVKMPTESMPIPATIDSKTQAMPESNLNYQGVLESLQLNMMRFHEHQAAAVRAHEQYLQNQLEYCQKFFQLMDQHYALLNTGITGANLIVPAAVNPEAISKDERQVVSPEPTTTAVRANVVEAPEKNGSPPVYSQLVGANNLQQQTTPTVNQQPHFEPEPISTLENNNGAAVAEPLLDVSLLTQSLLEIVSKKTGYEAQMLDLSMDMEADLGIDSIKRVEILGLMQEAFPDLPPVNPEELAELRTLAQIVEYMSRQSAPVKVEASEPTILESKQPENSSLQQAQLQELTKCLLEIVSKKTGYEAQMLDLSMDMEADLGIDSIKRVEILGLMQEAFPDLPPVNPEELAELRTLAQIVEYMSSQGQVAQKKT